MNGEVNKEAMRVGQHGDGDSSATVTGGGNDEDTEGSWGRGSYPYTSLF